MLNYGLYPAFFTYHYIVSPRVAKYYFKCCIDFHMNVTKLI